MLGPSSTGERSGARRSLGHDRRRSIASTIRDGIKNSRPKASRLPREVRWRERRSQWASAASVRREVQARGSSRCVPCSTRSLGQSAAGHRLWPAPPPGPARRAERRRRVPGRGCGCRPQRGLAWKIIARVGRSRRAPARHAYLQRMTRSCVAGRSSGRLAVGQLSSQETRPQDSACSDPPRDTGERAFHQCGHGASGECARGNLQGGVGGGKKPMRSASAGKYTPH